MNGTGADDRRLREAFERLRETSPGACSVEQADRIWRAIEGDLPPADRRELVEQMATDPAVAEAWRLAHELHQASRQGIPAASDPRARVWAPRWLAAAAVLVMAISAAVVLLLNRPSGDVFRTQDDYVVESIGPEGVALPRESFVLRWTPGPAGTRYQITVTTEDLRVLTRVLDTTVPETRIEPEVLSTVASGARVLWQVDATLAGGARVSSRTFVTRVQ